MRAALALIINRTTSGLRIPSTFICRKHGVKFVTIGVRYLSSSSKICPAPAAEQSPQSKPLKDFSLPIDPDDFRKAKIILPFPLKKLDVQFEDKNSASSRRDDESRTSKQCAGLLENTDSTSTIIDSNGDTLVWKRIRSQNPVSDQITYYLGLSKFRLTTLVVATTLAGFVMGCPTGYSMDPGLLTATLIGTGLTSASAASLNQFLEVPFDSQMVRTRNRPLVVGQLTPTNAFIFSSVSGVAGLSILATMVNPLTAALGAVNLVLYSFIYTPLKRVNIINTWIGSFVGAIPPVMGFTAVTGGLLGASGGGLLLGALLYSWQFPHFNALSWNLRHDYARAGYRMMSVTDPPLCLRTQLRHSLYLTAYCLLMSHPSVGLTTWTFAVDSLPFNLYLIYLSYKFWSDPGSSSSRKLFRYSLIHLPAVILLMVISKRLADTQEENKSRVK